MAEWMALMGALAGTLLGFAWLSLAMEDHWEQVYGASALSSAMRRTLRMMGATGLLTAGVLCFVADRPSMAILVWILLMAFGAVCVALTLTWKPSILRFAWPVHRMHSS